jgi:hypothetical protein
LFRVGAGDNQRQVLVLVVAAGRKGQLLMTMGRVINGIEVEGQVSRRGVEGGDNLVEEHVTQPFERLDGDGILEVGPGVAGELARRWFDNERGAEEFEACGQSGGTLIE